MFFFHFAEWKDCDETVPPSPFGQDDRHGGQVYVPVSVRHVFGVLLFLLLGECQQPRYIRQHRLNDNIIADNPSDLDHTVKGNRNIPRPFPYHNSSGLSDKNTTHIEGSTVMAHPVLISIKYTQCLTAFVSPHYI